MGVQKIGYAWSNKGYQINGTAAQEFARVRKTGRPSTNGTIKIYNPVGSLLKAIGGTDDDYDALNMMTGMGMEFASTYAQTYKPLYDIKRNEITTVSRSEVFLNNGKETAKAQVIKV